MDVFLSAMLSLLRLLEDPELSDEFIQFHDFVLLDTAELSAHHAIQHFIEVDVIIVDLDAHLQNGTLEIKNTRSILNVHLTVHAFR